MLSIETFVDPACSKRTLQLFNSIAGIKKKSVPLCPKNVPLKFSGHGPTYCLVWREHGVRRRRGGETEAFRQ